ncbi:Ig-like domain-containing protein, partial [Mycobacterium sp. B14F4]|uniref:Ig-like domain-containing protein n=1 Tax=Mycobacterium sp. B14F4 TaxID=3153565 RepID=UPI00325E648A
MKEEMSAVTQPGHVEGPRHAAFFAAPRPAIRPRYAKYIGRTGALAVALGIGTAMTVPGVALATPAQTETSSTTDSTAADGADDEGTDVAEETAAGSGPAATPSTSSDTSVTTGYGAGSTTQTRTVGEQDSPPVVVSSSGGALLSDGHEATPNMPLPSPTTESVTNQPQPTSIPDSDTKEATPPAIEQPASDSTDQPSTEPKVRSTRSGTESSNSTHNRPDTPTTATRVNAQTVVGTTTEADDRTLSSNARGLDFDSVSLAPPASELTAVRPAFTGPLAPLSVATQVISNVLTMMGWVGTAVPGPSVPGESPLLLALLGWARRQSQQTNAEGEQLTSLVAERLTSESLDDQFAATALATAVLSEPVIQGTTVGAADQSTGVVTGAVTATDADGDTLTYTLVTQPASGSVTVNSDGTFSYTPTVAARLAAQ